MASQPTRWQDVAAELTGPLPGNPAVHYQKHMTHHLLPDMGRDWLAGLTNCFLIRHPRDMLTSYVRIRERPTLADTGFEQQREIFAWVLDRQRSTPPVIDAVDVLNQPRRNLGLLCDALGIDFQDAMLAWPPGPRETDGVWAPHWYGEVEKSTGFHPYRPKNEPVPSDLADIYERCLECYDLLYKHRLR